VLDTVLIPHAKAQSRKELEHATDARESARSKSDGLKSALIRVNPWLMMPWLGALLAFA
jgi:hypothetical protein